MGWKKSAPAKVLSFGEALTDPAVNGHSRGGKLNKSPTLQPRHSGSCCSPPLFGRGAFGAGDLLQKMFEAFSRLCGVANSEDMSQIS
jgi:hypothetical protein